MPTRLPARAAPFVHAARTYRHVSRLENEPVLDLMAARLAARPDILDRRCETVEHPFGTIKHGWGKVPS